MALCKRTPTQPLYRRKQNTRLQPCMTSAGKTSLSEDSLNQKQMSYRRSFRSSYARALPAEVQARPKAMAVT